VQVNPAEPVVVSCHGELTISEAPALRDSLLTAIRAGALVVIVDLAEVSFVDQTATGVLVGARQRLVTAGGELRLAGVPARVARVLDLLNLTESLPAYPTVAAAAAAPLGSQPPERRRSR
jgi:anti-sigma B factor antagonist